MLSGPAADKAAYALLQTPTLASYTAALATNGENIVQVGVNYAVMPEFTFVVDGQTRHLHAVGVPPGASAVPHFHSLSSEHWWIVDGEVMAWRGEVFADEHCVVWKQAVLMRHGHRLFVPAGCAHTLHNPNAEKSAIVGIVCDERHMNGTDRTFTAGLKNGTPADWR